MLCLLIRNKLLQFTALACFLLFFICPRCFNTVLLPSKLEVTLSEEHTAIPCLFINLQNNAEIPALPEHSCLEAYRFSEVIRIEHFNTQRPCKPVRPAVKAGIHQPAELHA